MWEQGLGGAFLHAREGLIIPYLSKEWMNMIEVAVDESKKLGFDAWLYDEDKWPSGSVGLRITNLGEDYIEKTIVCKEISKNEIDKYLKDDHTIGVFTCIKDNNNIKYLKKIENKEAVHSNETVLVTCIKAGTGAQNKGEFVDLLDKKVMDRFIEWTHEAYYRRFGKEFGKTIPGIFTDEPNYSFVPWTPKFPEYFKLKKGYDIINKLPYIFYDGEEAYKIRYDFWSTITDLFVENFSKRLYDWCDKHNLIFTGHYLYEDDLSSQISNIGAAMPHYEFEQMPGIDHLGRRIADPMLVKQVSSVAHQFGDRRVLSELYGTAGWNVSFEDLKWIGEWQYCLGVNFPCQHLSLYSLRGLRKRDFPASLHYQQPWWKHYHIFNKYIARLLFMLTRGEHSCDVCVIHPVTSGWVLMSSSGKPSKSIWQVNRNKNVDKISNEFVITSENLLKIHRDYDYADEKIMENHGKVENDKFIIGTKSYKVVIIPSGVTLRKKTFTLLKDFYNNGGKIICIKPTPYMIEGVKSDELIKFLDNMILINNDLQSLKSSLDSIYGPDVKILDKNGNDAHNIYYQRRLFNDKEIYFFVNISKNIFYEADILFKSKGMIERWDLETGKVKPVKCREKDGYLLITLPFAPTQSHLIVLNKSREPVQGSEQKEIIEREITLSRDWNYKRNDPNALTLDYCKYRLKYGKWSDWMPVWKAKKEIDNYHKNFDVWLKFQFFSSLSSPKDIHLVLETPEQFEISVNDRPVEYKDTGYFWDISFKKVRINEFVKDGLNTIILKCYYVGDVEKYLLTLNPDDRPEERNRLRYGTELENIYIIGSFRLSQAFPGKFSLVDETDRIISGDIGKQGYYFYPGSFSYFKEIEIKKKQNEKIYLCFDKVDAVVFDVKINDKNAGTLAWRPLRLEITDLIKNGKNRIEIEIFGSLRNLLGPLHHKAGELLWVSPYSFVDEKNWTDEYNFVDFGITGDVKLEFVK